jgi:DNA-binding winged helix-turn-helix (wHTH) protein
MPSLLSARKLTFGVFEAHPSAGKLLKNGIPIKLPPQPFKVLLLLIERRGNVVTREEIREHLWGGATFVDFERGINFSINQIRGALSDEVEKPRYIETLPRIGYRFIADVAEPNGHSANEAITPRRWLKGP